MSKITDNIRYREKKFLSRYDLYVELFERFGLKVTDVVPLRNVYLLFTDNGKKILKKVEYSKTGLEFIYDAVEYIRRSLDRIISFNRTIEGEIFTIWNGELYCILDVVEGRECEFSNPLDVSIAAKGIAELHKASEGYRCKMPERYLAGRTIESFRRRGNELRFFKKLASLHEYKNEFDEIFLSNVDYYLKEVEKSIDLLKVSPYLKISGEEDKIVICHHDLAHHNILINNDKAYFVDFDYAVVDLKIHDICNFINKAVKNFAFDLERGKGIIEDYCTVNTLDRREIEVLKALITFPEDFYNISKDYYGRRKEWDEETFLDRLMRKVEYKEDREEFLEGFKAIIY
ncbi:MAG: CotS family spore coat protein [Bacillota bacterium]|nr:CotS family spore coat protein [Bacillota bacterium]